MFCPNCGAPNPDTATSCVQCNTALQAPVAPAPGKASPKFKGTMLMMSTPDKPIGSGPTAPGPTAPRATPNAPPQMQAPPSPFGAPKTPAGPAGGYPKTMMGGVAAFQNSPPPFDSGGSSDSMDSFDQESATIMQPASEVAGGHAAFAPVQPHGPGPMPGPLSGSSAGPTLGSIPGPGGVPSAENVNSTIAMDFSGFGVSTSPQGSASGPGSSTPNFGPPAGQPPRHNPTAPFGAPPGLGMAPPNIGPGPSKGPQMPPPPSQPPQTFESEGVASTVAVDASAFGLSPSSGMGAPRPNPSSAPKPGPAPTPSIPQNAAAGVGATMAMDVSAFGLGPGGPNLPGNQNPPFGAPNHGAAAASTMAIDASAYGIPPNVPQQNFGGPTMQQPQPGFGAPGTPGAAPFAPHQPQGPQGPQGFGPPNAQFAPHQPQQPGAQGPQGFGPSPFAPPGPQGQQGFGPSPFAPPAPGQMQPYPQNNPATTKKTNPLIFVAIGVFLLLSLLSVAAMVLLKRH